MGGMVSSHLSESDTLKKNQENMKAMNLQNMEKQMALKIAKSRDFFHWYSTFYTVAFVGLLAGYKQSKKPAILIPLFPLTFVGGFYWDMAYGNKFSRIRDEAESILLKEKELLKIPKHE